MKKYILLAVLIVLAAAGWIGYRMYNERNPDLTSERPDATLDANTLIAAFEKDSAAAGKQYTDKILAVTGPVKNINADGNPVIISLGDPGEMSSVQCSMDSAHADTYGAIKEGQVITLKGKCNGYESQELLGTDVKLNRCVFQNK